MLTENDSKSIAELHFGAFDGFFLTSLGKPFLKIFYNSIIAHEDGIAVGLFENEKLIAFAVGTKRKAGFYSSLLKSKMISMILSAIPKLIFSPSSITRLLKSLKSTNSFDQKILEGGSLLSICVCPNDTGRGLGKKVLEFFEEIAFGRCLSISLTTDALDNDYVNNFYKTNNYELYHVFLQDKRKMNLYFKEKK